VADERHTQVGAVVVGKGGGCRGAGPAAARRPPARRCGVLRCSRPPLAPLARARAAAPAPPLPPAPPRAPRARAGT
jgi:hypothetical protein